MIWQEWQVGTVYAYCLISLHYKPSLPRWIVLTPPCPLYTREMGGQLGCSYLIAQWTHTCTPHTHTRTHERALIIHFIRMPPTNMPLVINMTQSGTTTSLRRGLLIVLQYVITAWARSSMRSEYSVCSIHIGWTVQRKGAEFNSKLVAV